MKNIHKLAFTGKMGAGKTSASLTALGLFIEKYGEENIKHYPLKFANPLHRCAIVFHRKEKPRVFLQRLGDLARREFGDDVMERIFEEDVESIITEIAPTLNQEHILLITDDLRFLGEYNLLKKLGFTTIGIEASDEVRKLRIGPTFTNVKHRSEMEMEQFSPDFVIDNNEDDPQMMSLNAQLRRLLNKHSLIGD
jgi:hypothetical protein